MPSFRLLEYVVSRSPGTETGSALHISLLGIYWEQRRKHGILSVKVCWRRQVEWRSGQIIFKLAETTLMILSGEEIRRRLGGDISIDPFDPSQLNPNSYNLSLHNELLVYEEVVLDLKEPNRYRRLEIPASGLVLSPNQVYLARTVERTETHNLVPMIEGRSSIGRLGLFVHVTAGFGDVGFRGYWTLEMFAVQPIRIYPGTRICQIFYHTIEGEVREYCSGKYQNNTDIQPSLLYQEFGRKDDAQLKFDFPGA